MSSSTTRRRPSPPPPPPGLFHLALSEKRRDGPPFLRISLAEYKLIFFLLVLATFVRLFRISKPDSVVFDEVHFGKFAGRYIKTRYFVDVHPPLAKLLITAAAFLSGFNGDFDFKEIGKFFVDTPYVAMRMVPASLGVATIPVAYLTLRTLDCRATTALLAALFLTFENGLVTQSRYILLDSPLVFFTALTTFLFVGFSNENKREPFTEHWWTWLILTGLSLGAVLSCKWVGLFTVATVGVCTILQLWLLLGDLRITPRTWARHFFARVLCLILVPILFYMTMFELHFLILGSSGDGDSFMSSGFRQTLGRGLPDTYADVAFGSDVTIRHLNTQGGYLHSHYHNYPGGSRQQQITLYPHRDENNLWRIFNATVDDYPQYDFETKPLVYIEHGSRIRLRHITTDKALHSHDFRPPVSDVDFQNEVSGYGVPGFPGDLNDDWEVVIEKGDKEDKESNTRLKTLRTYFRLKHMMTGCYLFSHKVKLPEWGFEQQEVTCNKNAVRANSLWYIESAAKHPQFTDNAEKVNYKIPGFLSKFWELQQVMWTTNAGLTDRHAYDSRPQSWPTFRRGINFWSKDHRQIYLIGNPFVWWSSTASIVSYMLVRGFLVLRAKRGYRDFENTKLVKYDALCGFLFTGYFLHYFPFFLMSRQLFIHHYFPALYYAILMSCAIFDFATSTLKAKFRLQIAAVLAIMAIWTFSKFSPLAYGTPWTQEQCRNAQLLKTWDFDCNQFHIDYSQYNGSPVPVQDNIIPTLVTVGGEAERGAVVGVDEQSEATTAVPTGIVAEPGKDVFAKDDDRESAKSAAWDDAEPQDVVSSGDVDRVVSVVGESATVTENVGEPVVKKPEGPFGQEEAIADQVAHELYPEARDVAKQDFAHAE